ncbi:MAG TPA: hypothetical protein VGT78_12535 [Rhizomicrobium sp.]|nr:hypothetical protein [Rhizomicrobium sp.]
MVRLASTWREDCTGFHFLQIANHSGVSTNDAEHNRSKKHKNETHGEKLDFANHMSLHASLADQSCTSQKRFGRPIRSETRNIVVGDCTDYPRGLWNLAVNTARAAISSVYGLWNFAEAAAARRGDDDLIARENLDFIGAAQ